MASSKKKGGREPLHKFTCLLPEELVRRLKVKAGSELTSSTKIIIRALERELQEGGKEEPKK